METHNFLQGVHTCTGSGLKNFGREVSVEVDFYSSSEPGNQIVSHQSKCVLTSIFLKIPRKEVGSRGFGYLINMLQKTGKNQESCLVWVRLQPLDYVPSAIQYMHRVFLLNLNSIC